MILMVSRVARYFPGHFCGVRDDKKFIVSAWEKEEVDKLLEEWGTNYQELEGILEDAENFIELDWLLPQAKNEREFREAHDYYNEDNPFNVALYDKNMTMKYKDSSSVMQALTSRASRDSRKPLAKRYCRSEFKASVWLPV